MKKIAIFASGTGSNFDAIVEAIEAKKIPASVELMVCDKVGAKVIEKAQKKEIETLTFTAKEYASKADYESMLVKELQKRGVEWLVLAGFMRLLGPTLLEAFPHKIINIHPSLLPKYKGKEAIEQAYRAGERSVGVSIHYVDEGMDTGELIAQEAIPLTGRESLDEVKAMIHQVEHRLYPATLAKLLKQ